MLKIRIQNRRQASPPAGMRAEWTEYQVMEGRKILSRHDFQEQAVKWIEKNRPGETFALWETYGK